MDEKTIALFWSKVDKSGKCWNWTGRLNRGGYGMFGDSLAHRRAWFIEHGEYPTQCACHRCDNRRCVRPSHLFNGTRAENLKDMRAKGRGSKPPLHRGEGHPKSPLKESDVRDIRREGKPGNYSALGRRYGISPQAIRQIVLRNFWKHVE